MSAPGRVSWRDKVGDPLHRTTPASLLHLPPHAPLSSVRPPACAGASAADPGARDVRRSQMAPTISHSDGVPVVLDTPVNGKHGAAASSVRARALPDEYFHARLSTLARNRTHDGSACTLPRPAR